MRKGSFVLRMLACAGLTAGVALAAGPAVAKTAVAGHRQEEQVTVVAPRATRRVVGRTYTGANIDVYSLSRRVSYAHLNLTRYADVVALRQRIRATAKEACAELAQQYPLLPHRRPECVRRAIRGAMMQAQTAIAAAEK